MQALPETAQVPPRSALTYHEQLRGDGWTVMPAVVPDAALPSFHTRLLHEDQAQASARARTWTRASHGVERDADRGRSLGLGKAIHSVASLGPMATFVAEPRLLGAIRSALGAHVRVSSDFGIVTWPHNDRGYWHADWPYNQSMAAHIPAPYGDAVLHLGVLFMITPFTEENGGTLVLPGSHRRRTNPTADIGVDGHAPLKGEVAVTGAAGSALIYDARLWHTVAVNRTAAPRVALAVRFAPWWLNLQVRREGSVEARLVERDMPGRASYAPLLARRQYERLPVSVQPLYAHWVEHA
ncbi:MAG TPA: phytanoyl-CoA dioxygenase family protein [Myxococcota bacterium]|nr:phytanoyl-CoA dioxygenase family protein [Myxococcota bacterium]